MVFAATAGMDAAVLETPPRGNGLPGLSFSRDSPTTRSGDDTMSKKSAFAVLAACCVAMPGIALAASDADCAAQWKSADGNSDGVLVGPEADRYLAYYR